MGRARQSAWLRIVICDTYNNAMLEHNLYIQIILILAIYYVDGPFMYNHKKLIDDRSEFLGL